MNTQKVHLTFNGYWREPNKKGVPAERGIFCVYICTFDEERKVVSLNRLICIGSAENAREIIASHQSRAKWEGLLAGDQQLCYSFAPLPEADLDQVTTALEKSSGPAITERDHVNVAPISITLEGTIGLLKHVNAE